MNEFLGSYKALKGSLLRTFIYTIGHILIAITVLKLVADVTITEALTSATIEPMVNAVWFFILDRLWIAKE